MAPRLSCPLHTLILSTHSSPETHNMSAWSLAMALWGFLPLTHRNPAAESTQEFLPGFVSLGPRMEPLRLLSLVSCVEVDNLGFNPCSSSCMLTPSGLGEVLQRSSHRHLGFQHINPMPPVQPPSPQSHPQVGEEVALRMSPGLHTQDWQAGVMCTVLTKCHLLSEFTDVGLPHPQLCDRERKQQIAQE